MAIFIELFLLGVGLSMDAFAVSVCKGLGMRKLNKKPGRYYRIVFWRISGTYAAHRLASWQPVPEVHHQH